jgi:hypothetical protein
MTASTSQTAQALFLGSSSVTNGWNPIIPPSSSLSVRAWDAVHAISDAIRDKTSPPMSPNALRHRAYEDSLLFAWLGRGLGDEIWTERAADRLNAGIVEFSSRQPWLALYGGLCGLGWIVENFSRHDEDDTALALDTAQDDPNENIDAVLLKALASADWRGRYDLISGLVGFGVYFLERLPRPSAKRGIRAILAELEAISEPADGGMTWFTDARLLPAWQRELHPDGYYNLGVAHGVPGVLHLLNQIRAHGIESDRAERLLEGGVAWLMAQERPAGSRSRFGSWIDKGVSSDSRFAWCYGDLGITAVMLQIARSAGRENWSRYAHGLLDHCLNWPPDRSGIADAPICHGAAGAAHIFNRIYQAEGDPRCLDAALVWLERTLNMRLSGQGVGGFLSLTRPDPTGPEIWEPSPAFLDGAMGIALTFLAALTPVEPEWDRLLLVSGR